MAPEDSSEPTGLAACAGSVASAVPSAAVGLPGACNIAGPWPFPRKRPPSRSRVAGAPVHGR